MTTQFNQRYITFAPVFYSFDLDKQIKANIFHLHKHRHTDTHQGNNGISLLWRTTVNMFGN